MASKGIGPGSRSKSKQVDAPNLVKLERKHELQVFDHAKIKDITKDFEERCGGGNYGEVFRGFLKVGTKIVAVAVKTNKKENAKFAKAEFDALKALSHYPNIIPLIGFCKEEEIYCLVMNYVPSNLEIQLKENNLEWKVVVKILKQLAKALYALNVEKYVVADIKPDNILIDDRDYMLYLCDFGSAKKDGRDLLTKNYHYTAPEVLVKGNENVETDIFSFGVILLQMIMKVNNFHGLISKQKIAEQTKLILKNMPRLRKDETAPHLAVYARVLLSDRACAHVVHQSYECNKEDAIKISELGVRCTSDINGNRRPTIQEIIATLEQLKI